MRISDAEINAVISVCPRIYPSEAVALLEAAYTVRKQRKAAKRERQRKEKDKQVVESVKPVDVRPASCRFRLQDEGKPYPRSSCTVCGATAMNMGKSCRYSETPKPTEGERS